MIHKIAVTIRCESTGCRARFLAHHANPAGNVNHVVDSTRSLASTAGWGRFRSSTSGSIGDYCPKCVKTRSS
jgi:hypothetical protein